MNDNQVSKTENTATDEVKTAETNEDVSFFGNYDEYYEGNAFTRTEDEKKPIDDTGKTAEQSQLQLILKSIRKYAIKGQSEMRVYYICQYDWTKLSELGFKITNLSTGGNLEYKISWYSREQS